MFRNGNISQSDLNYKAAYEETKSHFEEINSQISKLEIKLSKKVRKANYKKANTVVIARGDNYVDALSATTLAKSLNGQILLSNTNKLAKDIENEIKRQLY